LAAARLGTQAAEREGFAFRMVASAAANRNSPWVSLACLVGTLLSALRICSAETPWSESDTRTDGGVSCPIPTLQKGDVCERVFANHVRSPCVRGRHSGLCVDFPTRPLTRSDYDAALATRSRSPYTRVQIIDNRMYIVIPPGYQMGGKTPQVALRHLRHLADMLTLHSVPDVDFILYPADAGGGVKWPAMGHCGLRRQRLEQYAERSYTIPTDTGVSDLTPPPDLSHPCPARAGLFEREEWASWRIDRLVYRGSANGPRVDELTWDRNERARLSALSSLFPDWIDSKLTQLFHTNQSFGAHLGSFIRIGRGMPMKSIVRYRYVMQLDGNAQANRLAALLHSGAIVLIASKYDTDIELSLDRLPHVFKVAEDLSDLLPILACLRAHPELALRRLQIGLAATRRLITYRRAVPHYWADALEHYASLQQFKVEKHPHAIEPAGYRYLVNGKWQRPKDLEMLVYPYNHSHKHIDKPDYEPLF
jgi:hypothetical protein